MARCTEYVGEPLSLQRCSREAVEIRLRCPAGRPDSVACYCELHGGVGRALDEASSAWNYAAPFSVGGAEAVEAAGLTVMQTPHAYVVLRELPAQPNGGRWLGWLGLGSMLQSVRNPAHVPSRYPHRPNRGAFSFRSRAEAEAAATATWHDEVTERIRHIVRLRCNLTWGLPVSRLDEPIVIGLGPTENAWDVAKQLPRRSPVGVAGMSGLRPTGEVL